LQEILAMVVREFQSSGHAMTARFEASFVARGFESIPGAHSVVAKGNRKTRFQISAYHTPSSIDAARGLLAQFAAQQTRGEI
jgi:7-keto-8-aminopelargonate synthetase-like enzyme